MQKHWITNLQNLIQLTQNNNDTLLVKLVCITNCDEDGKMNVSTKIYPARIHLAGNKATWYIFDDNNDALMIDTNISGHDLGFIKIDDDTVYVITAVGRIPQPKKTGNYRLKLKWVDQTVTTTGTRREAELIRNAMQTINETCVIDKLDV